MIVQSCSLHAVSQKRGTGWELQLVYSKFPKMVAVMKIGIKEVAIVIAAGISWISLKTFTIARKGYFAIMCHVGPKLFIYYENRTRSTQ